MDAIPEEYRRMECLNYLQCTLISQTVSNNPQVNNSYEFYECQLELAEQNRQLLEIQKQQLREIQAMKKMDEKDDDDDGSALGTVAVIE